MQLFFTLFLLLSNAVTTDCAVSLPIMLMVYVDYNRPTLTESLFQFEYGIELFKQKIGTNNLYHIYLCNNIGKDWSLTVVSDERRQFMLKVCGSDNVRIVRA